MISDYIIQQLTREDARLARAMNTMFGEAFDDPDTYGAAPPSNDYLEGLLEFLRGMEAAGRKVQYLNIGDPIPFGFVTPPHLVEAVEALESLDREHLYSPREAIKILNGAAIRGKPTKVRRYTD